jgi:hypothetical protein
MRKSAEFRRETLTTPVNPPATFTLIGVRLLATQHPELLPEASAWARTFHPKTTLARAA